MKWFSLSASDSVADYVVTECQTRILKGLAHATPPERALFHELVEVLGPGEDANVVEAALGTARALGCTAPATRCEHLRALYAKGNREQADAARKSAASARADCIAALRQCPAR